MKNDISNELIKDFSYPEPDDSEYQSKIFKKREFYFYNVNPRKQLESYDEIKNYRNLNCKQDSRDPKEHQSIITNFISPNTPYKGIILMYGVGSGKTMAAIKIAEQFKDQVKKYNTKIMVLVPGPNTKENFKKELILSTGEKYFKNKNILNQLNKAEIEYEKKLAIINALQYYKIISYKTFYKKVLGEKIAEKKIVNNKKIKIAYKKTSEGEYEREQVIDRITNLNNTLLIIDEAHNISGNEYGEALKKIIKNSENLRIILLTATPMINLADEIIDLLNFIRPQNDLIQRDKIFTNEKNYLMQIKDNGIKYLKEKAKGYISFYRGSIPYTFAKRIDKGIIPNDMLFTPVIKCYMNKFQYDTYIETTKKFDDTLDRASSAASNFVFPGLDKNKEKLQGYYSTDGLNIILSQLNTDGNKLRSLINKIIFNDKLSKDEENNFIIESNKKNITGLILKLPYIKYFSTKFYETLTNLNKLVVRDNTTSATAFIYSNLVKAGGIEIFAEILIQNGYLEYQDNSDYDIKDDTKDYKTGFTFLEFKKKKNLNINIFKPATFLLITGSSDDNEELPEIKQKIIQDVFNSVDNIEGKFIKFILGSRVMGEGITLKNCKEVHILDTFYNIPKIEQVIGRVIRMCVHQDLINDNYKYPEVNVYRYVVALNDTHKLSTDELLYQKAELKYLTVKKIERALKQVAIDCPLLLPTNIFPEEIDEYKNCKYPTLENIKNKEKICPALCDFEDCFYKCESKNLNKNHWDSKTLSYTLNKSDIDYNTFNDDLAKYEIIFIKNKIKDLFKFKHVYIYQEIFDEIISGFTDQKKDLFENYFLDQAIKDLMPQNENDFNNFQDIIYDKFNRPGYIIQRGIYFIFQPFDQNEDVPMYYRQFLDIEFNNQNSIDNYINKNYPNIEINVESEILSKTNNIEYNFDDTLDYYQERDEFSYVGIIDKNLNKIAYDNIDLFKIRPARAKKLEKKRGTGIPTLKGSVCSTKDKKFLLHLYKKLNNISTISQYNTINIKKFTKENICNDIKNKLLLLEKYATSKDKNKMTYIMIPKDHPIYKFPYNLEDRIKYIIKNITNNVDSNIDILVKKQKDNNNNIIYELSFKNNKIIQEKSKLIESYDFKKINDIWTIIID